MCSRCTLGHRLMNVHMQIARTHCATRASALGWLVWGIIRQSSLLMFAIAYRFCTHCHWRLCHNTSDLGIPGHIMRAVTKGLSPFSGEEVPGASCWLRECSGYQQHLPVADAMPMRHVDYGSGVAINSICPWQLPCPGFVVILAGTV